MKKIRLAVFIVIVMVGLLTLTGCGSSSLDFTIETVPKYKAGESSPISLTVTDGGEAVAGLDIVATLEMEKMDHGIIDVEFTDEGDGTYTGDVELPMGGEWIASIEAEQDDKTYDDLLTFEVKDE